jgi:hypothetical protein
MQNQTHILEYIFHFAWLFYLILELFDMMHEMSLCKPGKGFPVVKAGHSNNFEPFVVILTVEIVLTKIHSFQSKPFNLRSMAEIENCV